MFLLALYPICVVAIFAACIWGIYLIVPHLSGEITIGVVLLGLLALILASIAIKNALNFIVYLIGLTTLFGIWFFEKKKP